LPGARSRRAAIVHNNLSISRHIAPAMREANEIVNNLIDNNGGPA
jgi:hypothetical protein